MSTSLEFLIGKTYYFQQSNVGSDRRSIEPNGLRQLVGAVRKIEKALGNGKKDVTESEVPVAKKLREHIKEEERI